MAIYTERQVVSQGESITLKAGDVYDVGSSYIGKFGGAINVDGGFLTTSDDIDGYVSFIGNHIVDGPSQGKNGGAIYLTNCDPKKENKIRNAIFLNNIAESGSAVYNNSNAKIVIDNCIFEGNTATLAGAMAANKEMIVQNTSFINNVSQGAYNVNGAAIYVVGANNNVTVKDCYFSGNQTVNGKSGAIGVYTDGSLILQGENILDTKSDTIFNQGTLIFDISDKTSLEESSKAVLNHFNYIGTWGNYSLSVNVSNSQKDGIYLIANDASNAISTFKTTIKLKVNMNAGSSITVNDDKPKKVDGVSYFLKTNADNDLYLCVGDKYVFVNNMFEPWEVQTTRTAIYHGLEFNGKEEDERHFDKFSTGVAQAKKITGTLIGVDAGVVSYSVPLEGVTAELTSGTFSKQVFGGTIFTSGNETTATGSELLITGGTYQSNVIGGDFAQGVEVTQSEACNLAINDGIFNKAIAAGGFVSNTTKGSKVTVTDDVNLTISGGVFNGRVYGGIYATNDNAKAANSNITSDINILVKVGQEKIAFNDGLVAGSRGTGVIDGNVKVTFTGIVENSNNDNSNLVFGEGAKVWGGSNMDKITINGKGEYRVNSSVTDGHDRLLLFNNFKDNAFEAKVAMFKSIQAENSQVTFTCSDLDTTIVENWTLGAGCSLAGLVKNDFTGDTLNLTYSGKAENEIVFSGVSTDSLKGWNCGENKVTLNSSESLATWKEDGQYADGGYWMANDVKLFRNGNDLVLASAL